MFQAARLTVNAFKNEAKQFVKKDVKSVDAAIKGTQDILAERYAEQSREREAIRNVMQRFGTLDTKKTKYFNEKWCV